MRLRIAEIFASIQGEGIWVGTPSIFIRVSGCNLRCAWCDTKYASWEPEGPVMTLDQVIEQVQSLQSAARHVVLTGGEPMIFEPVTNLTQTLKQLGYTVTIETAGTRWRFVSCDLMSISPKLSNSTPVGTRWSKTHDRERLHLRELAKLIEDYPTQLKFVCNPDEKANDIAEIDALLANLPKVPLDRILLMPEGTDSITIARRSKALAPVCLAKGWRLSPRLHVDLFGNTRGT